MDLLEWADKNYDILVKVICQQAHKIKAHFTGEKTFGLTVIIAIYFVAEISVVLEQ